MIIDNIQNASLYYNVHIGFKKAFDFLDTINFNDCSERTLEVDGNDVRLIVSSNQLKNKSEALLETHRRHIDIHIPISDNETFGWKSAKKLENSVDKYNSDDDFELFHDQPTTYFSIPPGNFVVFLPDDAHAPLIGTGILKKLIFKITID